MKRVKPWVIILDIAIGIGVGLLFGAIPGIATAAIALMWSTPNQMTQRTKVILTVVLAVLVLLIPTLYVVARLTGTA